MQIFYLTFLLKNVVLYECFFYCWFFIQCYPIFIYEKISITNHELSMQQSKKKNHSVKCHQRKFNKIFKIIHEKIIRLILKLSEKFSKNSLRNIALNILQYCRNVSFIGFTLANYNYFMPILATVNIPVFLSISCQYLTILYPVLVQQFCSNRDIFFIYLYHMKILKTPK